MRLSTRSFRFCLAVFLAVTVFQAVGRVSVFADEHFPGKKSAWHGFDRFDFDVDSRKCIVVAPKKAAESTPWIWRARFFGHEPQADIALLEHGLHVVYCDVGNLFGNPVAVAHWDAFYAYLTEEQGFAPKAALEGMSRGGLIIYNWAAANPEKVSCIYGDAPVCDFKSWPGGKGQGKGSDAAWRDCLKAYGFDEEQSLAFKGNPIDKLQSLAKANIPLLNVVGDADVVVPVAENTSLLAARYRKLGGSIKVINKPGIGHHPHSLKDPTVIVEFVLKHSR
ncbi:MAG: alpha/beta hydrolase [Planctomycetes bacterium]|nr:alpha/beta hydrolase [Planctomycetota bacterium]